MSLSHRPISALLRRVHLLVLALLVIGSQRPLESHAADTQKPLPKFSAVKASVLRDFANVTDYRPGNIVSKSEVTPIFEHLRLMGWEVANRKGILAKVSGDSDFLVRQLRTVTGRKFMVKVAPYPLAYDRLHRISLLPRGRQTVHDLIASKNGEKFVEYLTMNEGGREFGKLLQNAPKGANFNAPTGRIYTADQLVDVLKQEYASERVRRGKKNG